MSGMDDVRPVAGIRPSKPPKRRDEDDADAEAPRPARKRPPRARPRQRRERPHIDEYA